MSATYLYAVILTLILVDCGEQTLEEMTHQEEQDLSDDDDDDGENDENGVEDDMEIDNTEDMEH